MKDICDHAAIDNAAHILWMGNFGKTLSRDQIATLLREGLRIMHEPPKPKTKTVEVWRVESAYHGHTRIWQANDGSKDEAYRMAKYLSTDGHTCIRVTGPHTQEIPNV